VQLKRYRLWHQADHLEWCNHLLELREWGRGWCHRLLRLCRDLMALLHPLRCRYRQDPCWG